MRIRLAIFSCSLAAILTTGLVFLPSSESSVSKPAVSAPKTPEFAGEIFLNHPKGYHLDSVEYESRGRPTDQKELAEMLKVRLKKR